MIDSILCVCLIVIERVSISSRLLQCSVSSIDRTAGSVLNSSSKVVDWKSDLTFEMFHLSYCIIKVGEMHLQLFLKKSCSCLFFWPFRKRGRDREFTLFLVFQYWFILLVVQISILEVINDIFRYELILCNQQKLSGRLM